MESKKTEFDEFNTDRAVRDEVGRGEISDEIENGGCGLCETWGSPISKERLEAVPETPYCLSCEKRRENE